MNTEQVLDTLIEAFKEKKGKDKIVFSFFQLKKFIALVEAAEREACAKVCEDYTDRYAGCEDEGHGYEIAAAIRARGEV